MISPLSGIEPLHMSQPTIQFYLLDIPTHDLSTYLDLNSLGTAQLFAHSPCHPYLGVAVLEKQLGVWKVL